MQCTAASAMHRRWGLHAGLPCSTPELISMRTPGPTLHTVSQDMEWASGQTDTAAEAGAGFGAAAALGGDGLEAEEGEEGEEQFDPDDLTAEELQQLQDEANAQMMEVGF